MSSLRLPGQQPRKITRRAAALKTYGNKEAGRVAGAACCNVSTTKLWQERVQGLVGQRTHKSAAALPDVYRQVAAAARPSRSGARSSLGGGHWWTEGYWAMLAVAATNLRIG